MTPSPWRRATSGPGPDSFLTLVLAGKWQAILVVVAVSLKQPAKS